MPRGGKVRSYPEDFKRIAIELALAGDKPISEIANELEMSQKTLHNWLKQHKQANNGATYSNEQDNSLQTELKRLRKENAQLKMERDILKKATAFFAKEAH